eukprot:7968681-Lingulodinium_polyedra.AAC.1
MAPPTARAAWRSPDESAGLRGQVRTARNGESCGRCDNLSSPSGRAVVGRGAQSALAGHCREAGTAASCTQT